MKKKDRKYIYLNNLDFNGTIFQTQILDWLYLYKKHKLEFELIQAFHIKYLKKPSFLRKQLAGLTNCTNLFQGAIYLFPSKNFLYLFNTIIILIKILGYLFKYHEILVFSRALIGKEINLLRKISPVKIIFFYDARAASAEENKYITIKQQDFTRHNFQIIANAYYLEYQTILAANKIFTVSNVLMNYYINTFAAEKTKFINYPCLSNEDKFFYDSDVRLKTRFELGIDEKTLVFIYSGGISNEWHVSKQMFAFFNKMNKCEKNLLFLCLIKNIAEIENVIVQFPALKEKLRIFSVPNNEVYKYLNAADYGILFRENTIMNNVASPTKFAEYILCGLPVLISEGVGDYSTFTIENEVGVLLKESELKNPEQFDFPCLFGKKFNRSKIAELGKQYFTKQSIIKDLVEEFIS